MPITIKSKQPVITAVPLTAEAREALLENMFARDLPHYGELFIPGDSFYINATGPKQAQHMLEVLCHWLGIKPGYIGLEFEGIDGNEPNGQRHTIYIEENILWNELLLGAYIANAMVRYLVEEKKQIHLQSTDQSYLLATGGIVFGLGLVIINGLYPIRPWFTQYKNSPLIFDNFRNNYIFLMHGYLYKHNIATASYSHVITPKAAKALRIKEGIKPIHAIREAKHKTRNTNVKIAGATWVIILAIGIGSFTVANRVRSPSQNVTDAQELTNLLEGLSRECKSSVAYERKYADLTDIQTVRHLNSQELRCESINNQRKAAEQKLQETARH